jgi:hypothetical protein
MSENGESMKTFALALIGILSLSSAMATEYCEVDFAGTKTLFNGDKYQTREKFQAALKKQSSLVQQLIASTLAQTGFSDLNSAADISGSIDSGTDLRVSEVALADLKDVYYINYYAGDTAVGALVQVVGRLTDLRGKPYALKILAKMGDGDWYGCDLN